MSEADLLAAVMLGALVIYALGAGADFGGGVWDLLASGPRAAAQRDLIEHAIAPVWEANHVWLVILVVLLFAGFPPAAAALGVALHLPLTLALLGIVMRGSAFVFRKYGAGAGASRSRTGWGLAFAIASLITPLCLGAVLGALAGSDLRTAAPAAAARSVGAIPAAGLIAPWLAPFPLASGGLALCAFAYLAAVYLTLEADDEALREDFRRRALLAWAATLLAALVAAGLTGPGTRRFLGALLGSPWSVPLLGSTALAALGGLAALLGRRLRAARTFAMAEVALLVLGWGFAQRPWLVYPDHTLATAAAPPTTLRLLLVLCAIGALVVVPALVWLLIVFKAPRGRGLDSARGSAGDR